MSWDANASAIVAQLRTQLQACASWTTAGGLVGQIHYPDGDYSVSALPAAIIRHIPGQGRRAYQGVSMLPSGSFEITIVSTAGTGALETLAQAIGTEICTDIGIAGLEVESIDPAEVSDRAEQIAANSAVYDCILNLTYGLED